MTITVFSTPEISCGACRSAIESAVAPSPGVSSVAVDLDAMTVTVGHDEQVTSQTLAELIEEQGYDVADTHEQKAGGEHR